MFQHLYPAVNVWVILSMLLSGVPLVKVNSPIASKIHRSEAIPQIQASNMRVGEDLYAPALLWDTLVAQSDESIVALETQSTSQTIYDLTRDLNQPGLLTMYGASTLDRIGESLTSCDVNGDGKEDAIIGVLRGDGVAGTLSSSGEVHVVLGKTPLSGTVDLATEADVILYGAEGGDQLGFSVACGDVNGDGKGDIVASANQADGNSNSRSDSGEVYVIFGRENFSSTLSVTTDANWTIYGAGSEDQAGYSLAIGDVDGDSKDDILIGASQADGVGDARAGSGEVYVVKGQVTNSRSVDLSYQADVTLYGPQAEDEAGSSLAAGDVNGDGKDDIIVGVPYSDGASDVLTGTGEVRIVLGRSPFMGTFDLGSQANWSLYGADSEDWVGQALSSDDVNSDGYDDILIGSLYADGPTNQRADAGEAYVVLGRTDLSLTLNLGTQADMTIYGAEAGDGAGKAVWAGDVNGDAKADIVIGAEDADGPDNGRLSAGEAYVLVGQSTLAESWDLADGAYLTLYGADAGDKAGSGLSGGDFDGDSVADLIVGAWLGYGPGNTRNKSGEAYVVSVPRADIRLLTTPTAAPDAITAGNGTKAQFVIQNVGEVTGTLDNLYMQVDIEDKVYQFPKVGDVMLSPGEVYTYTQSRMLYKTGTYTGTAGAESSPWHPLPVSGTIANETTFTINPLSYDKEDRTNGTTFWCGNAGEPVNTATGSFYSIQNDWTMSGPGMPFELIRTYNSQDADQDGAFGYGWAFNYDIFLSEMADETIVARFEDGKRGTFTPNGDGTYTAMEGLFDTLLTDGDVFTLTRKNQRVYRFNDEGRLTQVTDPDGLSLYLAHEAGYLTTITDTAGLVYAFDYDGWHIAHVRASTGVTLTYTYNITGELTHFTDAEGNTTTYTYDGAHRLLTITDPEGREYVDNEYDAEGRVVRQRDAHDALTTFTYAESGNTRTVVFHDALGHPLTHTYNISDQLIYEQDALGYVITRTYDAANNLLAMRDKNGALTRYTYDARGNMLSKTDAAGNVWAYTYDDRNNLLSETDPLNHTTTYEYDTENHLIKTTDPLSYTTVYTYNAEGLVIAEQCKSCGLTYKGYNELGQLVVVTNTLGEITRYTYDARGNQNSMTDAEGRTVYYEYDQVNRLQVITNTLGFTTHFIYNDNGNLVQEVNGLGYSKYYAYDQNENLVQEIDWAGNIYTYTYEGLNLRKTETDPLGYTTVYTYDAVGNLIAQQDKRGHITYRTYDGKGNMLSETDPLGQIMHYEYDALGRTVAITDALGNVTRSMYDVNGNLLRETDALGGVTRYEYDALNRQIKRTDALGHTWQTVYDPMGRVSAEIDPQGNRIAYTYDDLGQTLAETDALGHTTMYTYDAVGNRTSITNRNGYTTHYDYDAMDRAVREVDALGNIITRTYDALGNLLTETDPLGRMRSYTYDEKGNRLTETDSLGHVTTYQYDPLGRQISVTDANGHTTTYNYDPEGNLVTKTLPGGQVTAYTYDAVGNQTSMTNPQGQTTLYEYNALRHLVRETDPLGHTSVYTYDALGRRLSARDAEGHETKYDYDALGRLVQVTDALNQHTQYTYDALGNMTGMTDANQHTTTYVYDVLGRRIQETDPLSRTITYVYDSEGNLTRRTDARGWPVTYAYDALNRPIEIAYRDIALTPSAALTPTARFSVTPGSGYTNTVFVVDAAASSDSNTPPLPLRARWDWENDGHYDTVLTTTLVATQTYPFTGSKTIRLEVQNSAGLTDTVLQEITIVTFHSNTPPTAHFTVTPTQGYTDTVFIADPSGSSDLQDAVDRLTMRWDWDGDGVYETDTATLQIATHVYTSTGIKTIRLEIQDTGGLTAMISHTVTVQAYPFDGHIIYLPLVLRTFDATYDARRHLSTHPIYLTTDASPQTTSTPELTPRVVLTSMITTTLRYTYDAAGNLLTMQDPSGVTAYQYDQHNRLIKQTTPDGQVLSFAYDAVGNRIQVTYPDSRTVSYSYDANNWLVSVNDFGGLTTMRNTDLGLVEIISYPNGTNIAYGYDNAGRLISETHSAWGMPFVHYAYTLDSAGNKLTATETYSGAQGTLTETYTYDALYRLTDSVSGDGTENHYAYDPVGNRVTWSGVRRQGSELEPFTIAYTHDAANQLHTAVDIVRGTTTYTYGPAGNRVAESAPGRQVHYGYDGYNHLRQATVLENGVYRDGVQETYTYDGLGRRVKKTAWQVSSGTIARQREYVYDGLAWDTLTEYTGPETQQFSYRGSGQKMTADDGTTSDYFHTDALGSIIGYSDQMGDVGEAFARYDDYGQILEETSAPLTDYAYTGHEGDAYTGLVYGKHRYYDPMTGVWLSLDMAQGTPQNPQSLHRYAYVTNNPLNYVDPDGQFGVPNLGLLVAAIQNIFVNGVEQYILTPAQGGTSGQSSGQGGQQGDSSGGDRSSEYNSQQVESQTEAYSTIPQNCTYEEEYIYTPPGEQPAYGGIGQQISLCTSPREMLRQYGFSLLNCSGRTIWYKPGNAKGAYALFNNEYIYRDIDGCAYSYSYKVYKVPDTVTGVYARNGSFKVNGWGIWWGKCNTWRGGIGWRTSCFLENLHRKGDYGWDTLFARAGVYID